MILLSLSEQRLFDCLRNYLDVHQYSPSIQELQDITGERSRSKVQDLLKRLHQKGYIDWQPRRGRTYRVLVQGVPVLGVIQAGLVIEHPADLVEWVNMPGIPYRANLYALKVCGDSMINAHICEGDFVLLRPNPDLWLLKRNAIAAVWVEGEGLTLKYVEFDGQLVSLKPANPNYPTRRVDPNHIAFQGIVISVHRYYELPAQ
jgi:repressor LexA